MGRTGLSKVRSEIEAAASDAGRSVDSIALVVVTKYASEAAVRAVIDEGAADLGENRAQDLKARVEAFGDAARWHFIGRLQRNKVNAVRPRTHLLHSMDRTSLAERWADPAAPPVLVQVNVAEEPQKAGVTPSEAPALVERCHELGIEVRGLMTVPPRVEAPVEAARWFAALRDLRDRIGRDHPGVVELSMGMTDDFTVAVSEGATILRVGRAIFDPFDNEG